MAFLTFVCSIIVQKLNTICSCRFYLSTYFISLLTQWIYVIPFTYFSTEVELLYFSDCKTFPPQIWGWKWGCIFWSKCSLPGSRGWGESIMLFMLFNILPHFLLQNFFSYFLPLKPRCVVWSEKYSIFFRSLSFIPPI